MTDKELRKEFNGIHRAIMIDFTIVIILMGFLTFAIISKLTPVLR